MSDRLPLFCRVVEASANEGEDDRVLWGMEAVGSMFKAMQLRVAKGAKYDFESLSPFHIFRWLMTDRMLDSVNGWTTSLLSSLEADGVASSSSTAVAPRQGGRRQAQTQEGQETSGGGSYHEFIRLRFVAGRSRR